MKIFLLLVFSAFFVSTIDAQSLRLVDVITVSSDEENLIESKGDEHGGVLKFERTYRTGCEGSYSIKWKFNSEILTLEKGEEIKLDIECVDCSTPCGYRWTQASVGGANNIIKDLPGYPMEYNGNISSTSSTGKVHAWYEGHLKHSFVLNAKMTKNVPTTAFYITMGSHTIYYIYQKGTASSQNINCHTLFGLGKLVASLELGARENYGWTWMESTIDYALTHITASNCLSDEYLTGLKKRIQQAPTTEVFFDEIHQYSLSLDTEILESCACCGSCKND